MTSHAKAASIEPKRLGSGVYTDRCDDCGSIITGATADDVLAASCRCHERRTTQLVVELVCLMCGRELGTVQVPKVTTRVLIPTGLRCDRCGGQPVVDDIYSVSVYPNLPPMHVKRGRPHKRRLEEGY